MARLKYPQTFYVYQLVDPRDGLPFYVGKGTHDRAWQHERAVRRGDRTGNAAKVARIEAILVAGLKVEVTIIAEHLLEADALEHEFRLVRRMVTLTNAAPGGLGKARTPEQLARQGKRRARRQYERRAGEREALRLIELDELKAEVTEAPGADRHATEIDAWFSSVAQSGGALIERRDRPGKRLPRRDREKVRGRLNRSPKG